MAPSKDNSTIAIASAAMTVNWRRRLVQVGGGEAGYMRPIRPIPISFMRETTRATSLARQAHRQVKKFAVWPIFRTRAAQQVWNIASSGTAPIVISPQDPNTIYYGGERVLQDDRWRRAMGSDQSRSDA